MQQLNLAYEDGFIICDIEEKSWHIKQAFNNKLKGNGYRWDPDKKVWKKKINLNHEKLQLKNEKEFFEFLFPGLYNEDVFGRDEKPVQSEHPIDKDPFGEVLVDNSVEINKNLRPFQIQSNQLYVKFNNTIMLAHTMGLGKTLTSLSIGENQRKRFIVIVTKNMTDQWKEEILKWNLASEDQIFMFGTNKEHSLQDLFTKNYKYYIFHYERFKFLKNFQDIWYYLYHDKALGDFKIKRADYDEMMIDYKKCVQFCNYILGKESEFKRCMEADADDYNAKVSYDKVKRVVNKLLKPEQYKLLQWLSELKHEDFIVSLDETYKVKNAKSELGYTYRYFRKYPWSGFMGLSGTPIVKNLFDFFNVLNLIRPGWMDYNYFIQNFTFKVGDFGKLIFKNLDWFNALATKTIMHRLDEKEAQKYLPPVTYEYKYVDSPKLAHQAFDRMKDLVFNSEIEGYTLYRTLDSYFNPGPHLKHFAELKGFGEIVNEAKYEEFTSALDEIGDNQVLVFTSFEKTAIWLKQKMKKDGYDDVEYVSSDTKNVQEIRRNFMDGKLKYVIATDVWQHGQNFSTIDYEIQWDIPLSWDAIAQRRDRIRRSDDPTTPKFVIFMVGDIIENAIMKIVKSKLIQSEKAVEGEISDSVIRDKLQQMYGLKPKV